MSYNPFRVVQQWSSGTVDIAATNDLQPEAKGSRVLIDPVPSKVDSMESLTASQFSALTSPPSRSVVSNEEGQANGSQQIDTADDQDSAEVLRSGESVEQNDQEVIMSDTVTATHHDWNPTHAELYAIAFENEAIEIEGVVNAEHSNDAESRDQMAEPGDQEPRNDDANVPSQQQVHNDSTDGNDGSDSDEHQDGNTPTLQNPWGLTDVAIDELMRQQELLFGYIRDRDSAPKQFTCVCGESSMDPSQFINLTCPDNCVRCIDCLNSNVRVGLESRKNYPPRCCVPIDFENVLDHIEFDLIDRWLEIRPEYEDIAPVYCSVKTCSLYLPRTLFTSDGRWAECKTCDAKTCTACLCPKSQHDENAETCPERLDQMDKDLIKRRGWKACPRCREMIERTEGCDHMVCECGQEFCYGCGRSYTPPMPCNCHGQNQWAAQIQAEADPRQQQEIMNRIANEDHGGRRQEDDEDEDEDEDVD